MWLNTATLARAIVGAAKDGFATLGLYHQADVYL
jgi:hypothetical protein